MEESVPFVVSRLADFLEELTTDVDLVLLVSDVFEILLPFLLVAVVPGGGDLITCVLKYLANTVPE